MEVDHMVTTLAHCYLFTVALRQELILLSPFYYLFSSPLFLSISLRPLL